MHFYIVRWRYTLDQRHGFGILFDEAEGHTYRQCFYEDGTLKSGEGIPDYGSPIDQMERYSSDRWGSGSSRQAQANYEKMMKEGSCSFVPGKDRQMAACLTIGKENVQVRVEKATYGYSVICNCGKRNCGHDRAAADFLERRLASLQHAYVVTELPVDKSIFLESDLETKILRMKDQKETIIEGKPFSKTKKEEVIYYFRVKADSEVKEGDTPEVLQKRVMEEAEWIILPEAVRMVSDAVEKGERI